MSKATRKIVTVPDPEPPRNAIPKSPMMWLKDKVKQDNLPDQTLWRVRDGLYDLTSFAKRHPGGRAWIEATRGLDVTEAFEVSHLNIEKVELTLKKYFVRSCDEIKRRYIF